MRATQIDIPSLYITAIEFQTQVRKLLVFLVRIPPKVGIVADDEAYLESVLQAIEDACGRYPNHKLIVGGDFNRHDQL